MIKINIEIIYLDYLYKKQSCVNSLCCCKNVMVNNTLIINFNNNNKIDEIYEVYITVNKEMRCKIAYIPREYHNIIKKKLEVNSKLYLSITEIYNNSENIYKRKISKKNKGMAACIFLN